MRAKSNLIESGRVTVEGFNLRKTKLKGKRRASVLSRVVQFELIFRHPCFYVGCACIEFFGEVGHFTDSSSGFLELCQCHLRNLVVYRVASYDIGERRSVQDEETGP